MRLEIYSGAQGTFSRSRTTVMFTQDEPIVVLGAWTGRKMRFVFHQNHYRRLVPVESVDAFSAISREETVPACC